MAAGTTLYHFTIALSDVERGVYETLDLRAAQHPSESLRYLVTRTLAYALAFETGIAFSKGGVSSDEPAISVRDATGVLARWIEIGSPSAERLHKASKAARRVAWFTSGSTEPLREAARTGAIHRAEAIEVHELQVNLLDAIAERLERTQSLELVHTDGQLYVTLGAEVLSGTIERSTLIDPD